MNFRVQLVHPPRTNCAWPLFIIDLHACMQVVEAAKEWINTHLPPDVGSKRDMAHVHTSASTSGAAGPAAAGAGASAGAVQSAAAADGLIVLPDEAAMAHTQKGSITTSDGDEGKALCL